MRAFYAHLRTELRDQRSGLITVAVALAVLTPLAFGAFGDRLVEAEPHQVTAVFVAVALVLYLFAVVGDLYAGETRRDTIAFLRRTPRGLGLAFGAKALLTILAFAAVVVWECVVLTISWNLWGGSLSVAPGTVFESGFLSPLTLLVAVLAPWVVLASTWLRHGGIAILLAPMLAAAVVAPGMVWAQANPVMASFVMPDVKDAVWAYAPAVAAVPFAAAAWSWLGGRHVVRSAWSAAWRGMVLVLIASAGTYAAGAVRLAHVRDIRPGSPGFRIHSAFVSPGGGRLYLTVSRRAPSGEHATPARSWTVDLGDGSWSPIGRWGEVVRTPTVGGITGVCGADCSLEPQPRLILNRVLDPGGGDERWLVVWVDAETGDVIKVVPTDVWPPDVEEWYDEAGRRASWLRDTQGRRTWLRRRDWALRREDDGIVETVARVPSGAYPHHPIPGGWSGWGSREGRTMLLDVDTGETRLLDVSLGAAWVSPRMYLSFARGEEAETSRWWLEDAVTGERKPARGAPADLVAALTRTCVLGLTMERPRRLLLWNPRTGSAVPLPWPADPTADVAEVWTQGRAGSGDAALVAKIDEVWAVARLDPNTYEVRSLVHGARIRPWVIALTADGGAIAIEQEKRVVRYGPGEGRREVLFPR